MWLAINIIFIILCFQLIFCNIIYNDIQKKLIKDYNYDYTSMKYENINNTIYNSNQLYRNFEKFINNNIPTQYKALQKLLINNKVCINNNPFIFKSTLRVIDWSLLKDIDRYIFQKNILDNNSNYNRINNEIISSCNSIDNLLNNVRLGKRECSLSLLSSNEILNILSSFSQVIWIGDSLTRHMHQGTMLLLTEDLVCGAIPILTSNYKYSSGEMSMCETCHCDGMFSENGFCREDINITQRSLDWREFHNISLNCMVDNGNNSIKSRYQSICNKDGDVSISNKVLSFQYITHISTMNIEQSLSNITCNKNDNRPKLIFLQGGVGHEHRSEVFFENSVKPLIEKIKSLQTTTSCQNSTIYMVFSFGCAMKRYLNKSYPNQTHEKSLKFNYEMENKIKFFYPNEKIFIIDFFNITVEADSSDGYHLMMGSNIQKSNIVLKLMNHISNL
jgi:hypothetical protein